MFGQWQDLDTMRRMVDEIYEMGAISVLVPERATHRDEPLSVTALLVQLPAGPPHREPLIWYLAALGAPRWWKVFPHDARERAGCEYYLLARREE